MKKTLMMISVVVCIFMFGFDVVGLTTSDQEKAARLHSGNYAQSTANLEHQAIMGVDPAKSTEIQEKVVRGGYDTSAQSNAQLKKKAININNAQATAIEEKVEMQKEHDNAQLTTTMQHKSVETDAAQDSLQREKVARISD